MADHPPPYAANEKAGYPPQPQAAYPPQPQPGYPPQQGYPPPQAGYNPPPQAGFNPPPGQAHSGQQATTVVVTQPAASVIMTFNVSPVRTMCPHCRADVVTSIHYENGTLSWLLCVILCIIGCNLGCCFIPFCVEGCQDVIHTCPNCRQQMGRYSRM